jgi:hypothetical protein
VILSLTLLGSIWQSKVTSQNSCAGYLGNNSGDRTTSTCANSTTAYLNKYRLQSTFIPSTNDPVITLKITLHIFQPGGSNINNGVWQNTTNNYNGYPALNAYLYGNGTDGIVNGQTERYSVQRSANYLPSWNLPQSNLDSRIKYEITNIYWYSDNTLYNTNAYNAGPSSFFSHISSINGAAALEEGLPIVINGANTGHATNYNNGPCVFTSVGAGDSDFFRKHLRHEINHCFMLMHTYGGTSCCPEIVDCNYLDFLSDVFPINNSANCNNGSNAPLNTNCNTCNEWINLSNNCMGESYPNPLWISPLQMGRKIRNMHLTSNNIRKFAKDCESQHTFPLQVTSNETWDFDIQMYKDIVVKAPATLTIKCKVAMAILGKIQVEKGAQLIIDGGEVTGWCKTGLWGSIQVEGDPAQNQTIYTSGSLTGYAQYQGVLRLINGGKVTHSGNAITNFLKY